MLSLWVVLESTSHHHLIQQALQRLEEGLATECSSNTHRIRKNASKDGKKGGRGGWLLYWTCVVVVIIIIIIIIIIFFYGLM